MSENGNRTINYLPAIPDPDREICLVLRGSPLFAGRQPKLRRRQHARWRDRPGFGYRSGSQPSRYLVEAMKNLQLAFAESSKGIIAVDDFLNPLTLGVNEAIHYFFAQPRLVVPVAYFRNKVFLAHRSMANEYLRSIENSIIRDEIEPESTTFRDSLAQSRQFVEQELWGHRVLICP
jgi:hypothetical protein